MRGEELTLADKGRTMSRLRAAIALALFLAGGFLLSADAGVKLGTISVGAGIDYASGPFLAGVLPSNLLRPVVLRSVGSASLLFSRRTSPSA